MRSVGFVPAQGSGGIKTSATGSPGTGAFSENHDQPMFSLDMSVKEGVFGGGALKRITVKKPDNECIPVKEKKRPVGSPASSRGRDPSADTRVHVVQRTSLPLDG